MSETSADGRVRLFEHGCGNRTWIRENETEPDGCGACRIDAPWQEPETPWAAFTGQEVRELAAALKHTDEYVDYELSGRLFDAALVELARRGLAIPD